MGLFDFIGDVFADIAGVGNMSQTDLQNRWTLHNQKQNQQWEEGMWNKQNAYNTPSAQKQRMQEAGMNPWSPEGQGYAASSNSQSLPSSNALPGASPGYTGINGFNAIGQLADAYNAIANAKKAGVDTEFLKRTLDSRIADVEARSKVQGIIARYQDQLSKKELKRLDEVIGNLFSDTQLKNEQTNVSWETRFKTIAEKNLAIAKTDTEKQMYKELNEYFKLYFKRDWESKINERNASARESNAKASEANANKGLIESKKEFQDFQNLLNNASSDEQKAYVKEQWSELKKRLPEETKKLQGDAEKALAEGDWAWFRQITGGIGEILGSIHPFIGSEDTNMDKIETQDSFKDPNTGKTVKGSKTTTKRTSKRVRRPGFRR